MTGDPQVNRVDEVIFVLAIYNTSFLPAGASVDKMENLELVDEHEVVLNLLVESVWNFYGSL